MSKNKYFEDIFKKVSKEIEEIIPDSYEEKIDTIKEQCLENKEEILKTTGLLGVTLASHIISEKSENKGIKTISNVVKIGTGLLTAFEGVKTGKKIYNDLKEEELEKEEVKYVETDIDEVKEAEK